MKRLLVLFAVLMVTVTLVSPASATAGLIMNTWVHTSEGLTPAYPTVQTFAFLPGYKNDGFGHVFAGTSTGGSEGGLAKSTNSGVNWTSTTLDNPVRSLAVSPNYGSDHLMVAGTASAGAWKTTDEWTTPVDITGSLPDTGIQVVAFSPYYASDHQLFAGTWDSGLFFTLTLGATWIACAAPYCLPDGARISGIVFTPNYSQSHTLFVAVDGSGAGLGGVYQGIYSASPSPHFAWTRLVNGITDLDITSLVISPNYTNDHTLYIGTYGTGIFKTTNSGTTWVFVEGTESIYVQALAISPDYAYDRSVYMGEDGHGVYRYVDNAAHPVVAQMNTGFPDPNYAGSITALAFAPGRCNVLFGGYLGNDTYGGVWQYLFPCKIFLPCVRK